MPHFLDLISPQVESVGMLAAGKTNKWKGLPRIIYNQQIILVREGTIRTHFHEFSKDNPADSYILKPHALQHRSEQISNSKIQLYWVHFDWSYTDLPHKPPLACYRPEAFNPDLQRPVPEYAPNEVLHGVIRRPAHVYSLFLRLYHRMNFGTSSERASCRGVFLELLIELLGEDTDYLSVSGQNSADNHLAYRIQQMLHEVLDHPKKRKVTLAALLEKTGYSYPYLSRLFRKKFGISPLGYLNQMRIDRAKSLLTDTLLPIHEIAREVGIDNAAYFARLFVKDSGYKPAEFREKNPRSEP